MTWAKAANARRYELRITVSDGRRLFVRPYSIGSTPSLRDGDHLEGLAPRETS